MPAPSAPKTPVMQPATAAAAPSVAAVVAPSAVAPPSSDAASDGAATTPLNAKSAPPPTAVSDTWAATDSLTAFFRRGAPGSATSPATRAPRAASASAGTTRRLQDTPQAPASSLSTARPRAS